MYRENMVEERSAHQTMPNDPNPRDKAPLAHITHEAQNFEVRHAGCHRDLQRAGFTCSTAQYQSQHLFYFNILVCQYNR